MTRSKPMQLERGMTTANRNFHYWKDSGTFTGVQYFNAEGSQKAVIDASNSTEI